MLSEFIWQGKYLEFHLFPKKKTISQNKLIENVRKIYLISKAVPLFMLEVYTPIENLLLKNTFIVVHLKSTQL
jgi:hypothetical protein